MNSWKAFTVVNDTKINITSAISLASTRPFEKRERVWDTAADIVA